MANYGHTKFLRVAGKCETSHPDFRILESAPRIRPGEPSSMDRAAPSNVHISESGDRRMVWAIAVKRHKPTKRSGKTSE